MTVRNLINQLESFNDDMEVVMKPSDSMYVDGISETKTKELRVFYGENRDVIVIAADGKLGAV